MPRAKMIEKLESKRHTTHIWATKDGLISVDDRIVNIADLSTLMYSKISKDPRITAKIPQIFLAKDPIITAKLPQIFLAKDPRIAAKLPHKPLESTKFHAQYCYCHWSIPQITSKCKSKTSKCVQGCGHFGRGSTC